LLSDVISRAPSLFIEQASLLKKIQFPKLALVVIALLNSLVNFAVIFALFMIFLVVCGQFPGWSILAVIPLLLLQLWIGAALMVILAILNVFFRDVGQLTNLSLQFGFWLTPIVYSASMIPVAYRDYVFLNPLSAIFDGYHQIFVYGLLPNWGGLIPAGALASVLSLIAVHLFTQRSAEMVDEL
jgi:lipopolysaccharide transport system permease protein